MSPTQIALGRQPDRVGHCTTHAAGDACSRAASTFASYNVDSDILAFLCNFDEVSLTARLGIYSKRKKVEPLAQGFRWEGNDKRENL